MLTHDPHVSLADLSAAGVRVRPAEAVTLVRELAVLVTRDGLPGVPSARVVHLAREGRLLVEGPVAAEGRGVLRAAHLLDTMLPGFDAPSEFRVPGALRLVIARALGTLDLPPYPSLHEFVDALTRFSLPDTASVVSSLYAAWATALAEGDSEVTATPEVARPYPAGVDTVFPGAPPIASGLPTAPPRESESHLGRHAGIGVITVSDIRRARRATGLTLGEIARRSRIPVWLLRELESGDFRNWPASQFGRMQLTRYARAAGLDERLVVATLWPMIEDDARGDVTQVPVSTPEDPAERTALGWISSAETVEAAGPRRRRTRLLAARPLEHVRRLHMRRAATGYVRFATTRRRA
jgi:hypothetical protein